VFGQLPLLVFVHRRYIVWTFFVQSAWEPDEPSQLLLCCNFFYINHLICI
jgi:hypothetical protein